MHLGILTTALTVFVAILSAPMLVGCATQHLQTERELVAAGFQQFRGTAEVNQALSSYHPYAFSIDRGRDKKKRIVFASPARKTLFVGDDAAMSRFDALQQQKAYNAAMRAEQQRMFNAQLGQAWAAQAAAQQQNLMQQQTAMYQSFMQQPAAEPFYSGGFSRPAAIYPTLPHSSVRDYSRGAIGVIE